MIEYIKGKILYTFNQMIIVETGSFALRITTPQPEQWSLNQDLKVYIYSHWSQDNGPSLFGFQNEIEKKIFEIIITCPKIGPSIAITILSQLEVETFANAILDGDVSVLNSVKGVGTKKAEQLILSIKDKIEALLATNIFTDQDKTAPMKKSMTQQLKEALVTLNYSKQEISNALTHVSQKHSSSKVTLDQALRTALTFFSQNHA